MSEFDDTESRESYEAPGKTPPPLRDQNGERSRLEWLALPMDQKPCAFDFNMQEHSKWLERKQRKDVTS